MKAVVIKKKNRIEVRDIPVPNPGPGEVQVKVAASGICGTDIHILHGEFPADYPVVPGHEFAGVVSGIGAGVTGYKAGDRVAVDPNLFCGACRFCRTMRGNHCLNWEAIGVTRDGGFAEYVVAPVSNVYSIDDLDFTTAAFIEPLSCVVHGARRLDLSTGGEVLLVGAGPIGLLLLQVLNASGSASTIVVDRIAERLELAKSLGADQVLTPGAGLDDKLKNLRPYGFDAVVDATGDPKVLEWLFGQITSAGKMLVFGVPSPKARISVSPFDIYRRDLSIIGTFALNLTFEPAIALLKSGRVQVQNLLSHTLPFEEAPQAMSLVGRPEAMKVMFQP